LNSFLNGNNYVVLLVGKGFRQNGGSEKQLQRVHLIAQMRNKREGKKGLYGAEMSRVAGGIKSTASKSVAFLKSVFLPIIVTLNPLVKKKFPFSKTRNIQRWPGGAGHGKVVLTGLGTLNPMAVLNMEWLKEDKSAAGHGTDIILRAVQQAINDEGSEMLAHTQREMQRRFDSHPDLRRVN